MNDITEEFDLQIEDLSMELEASTQQKGCVSSVLTVGSSSSAQI